MGWGRTRQYINPHTPILGFFKKSQTYLELVLSFKKKTQFCP